MKKLLQKFRLNPDTLDGKAVLISFLIINFAFLFHTLNFMWGNHDVKFIKEELQTMPITCRFRQTHAGFRSGLVSALQFFFYENGFFVQ